MERVLVFRPRLIVLITSATMARSLLVIQTSHFLHVSVLKLPPQWHALTFSLTPHAHNFCRSGNVLTRRSQTRKDQMYEVCAVRAPSVIVAIVFVIVVAPSVVVVVVIVFCHGVFVIVVAVVVVIVFVIVFSP